MIVHQARQSHCIDVNGSFAIALNGFCSRETDEVAEYAIKGDDQLGEGVCRGKLANSN